ncbi:hypothetical protein MHBO_000071 [Bonamia ostreae]|uniref:Uncharacterized protein n=1 Tax=Bonamia ostreae TaxID=126728 RepID=A0ABV2AE92_9EUKA
MFPSIKRDFSKISFDLLNSLNRFKDPFVNLTDSEPSISIDSLVSASQGSKEIVYKIQNLNVKLNEKMIKLSIEALKTIGFFKWQKILEFLNSKNENIVINDESLKYCKILALLVINEICKKAFNSGDFDLSSKLAFILRTETNKVFCQILEIAVVEYCE